MREIREIREMGNKTNKQTNKQIYENHVHRPLRGSVQPGGGRRAPWAPQSTTECARRRRRRRRRRRHPARAAHPATARPGTEICCGNQVVRRSSSLHWHSSVRLCYLLGTFFLSLLLYFFIPFLFLHVLLSSSCSLLSCASSCSFSFSFLAWSW